MITRKLVPSDAQSVKALIRMAFSGFPWFENLDETELEHRWQFYATRNGFTGLVAEDEGLVVSAIWWDTPTLDELAKERGQNLSDWACEQHFSCLVWERDVATMPSHAGHGLATHLRHCFLSTLSADTLVLTRMRSDNIAIQKIAKRLGFERTGITLPSSQSPGQFHEYWFKTV